MEQPDGFNSDPARILHAGDTQIDNNLEGDFTVGGLGDTPGTLTLNGSNGELDVLEVGGGSRVDAVSAGGDGGAAGQVIVKDGSEFRYSGSVGSIAANGNVKSGIDDGDAPEVRGDVRIGSGGVGILAGEIGGELKVRSGTVRLAEGRELSVGETVSVNNADSRLRVAGALSADEVTVSPDGRLDIVSTGRVSSDIRSKGRLNLLDEVGGEAGITGAVTVARGTARLQGEIDGDLSLERGASLEQTDDLAVSGTLDNAIDLTTPNDLTIGAGINSGTITVDGGTLTVTGIDGGPATIANSGTVTVGSVLTGNVDGGDSTVSAGGLVDGDLRSADGTITIEGATDGTADVTGDVVIAAEGGTTGTGNLQGDIGGDVVLEAGTTANQTGTLAIGGAFDNGTDFEVVADIEAGRAANSGTLDVSTGTLTLTEDDAVLDNSGTLTVGTEVAGDVVSTGTATVEDGGTVTGSIRSAGADADLVISGTVTGDVDNVAGSTAILGGAMDDGGEVQGDLTNSGTMTAVTADGGLNIVGGDLLNRNDGTLTVESDLTVGGDAVNAGQLDVTGGTLRVEGAGGLRSSRDLTVGQGATVIGNIASREQGVGPATLSVAGRVEGNVSNGGGSTLTLGGATDDGATIDGILRNSGTATLSTDATGQNVVTGGIRNLDGEMTVSGNLTADVRNNAGLTLDGNAATVVTGDIRNEGNLTATGTMGRVVGLLSGDGIVTIGEGDALEVTERLTVGSDGRLNLDGTLTSDLRSNGTVEMGGVIIGDADLRDGTATLAGDIGGTLDVRAPAEVTETGDLAIAGQFTNAGSVTTGGDVAANGGLVNDGSLTVGAGTTLSGDMTVLDNNGDLTVDGRVTDFDGVNSGRGSSLTLGGGGEIVSDVTSRGRADLDGTVTGSFINRSEEGVATIAGDVTGGVSNATGAQLTFDGSSTIGGEGIDNRSRMTVTGEVITDLIENGEEGDLTVTGRVDGDIDSIATLDLSGEVTGDVGVTAGDATVGGDIGGNLTVTGGTLAQGSALDVGETLRLGGGVGLTTTADVDAGTVSNAGTLSLSAGDTLTITDDAGALNSTGNLTLSDVADGSGGVVGDVNVTAGSASVAGDIDGNLALSAGTNVIQGGTLDVTGNLTNDTTLETDGDISAGTVANGGNLTVASGDTVAVTDETGNLANTGTLQLDGTVDGDLTSSGDLTMADADPQARVTGDLAVTAGTASLAGRVGGDLDLTGGTVTQGGDLSVGGTLDNATTMTTGGDLDVGGLTNSGDLTLRQADVLTVDDGDGTARNTGTLRVAGDVAGGIESSAGNLVLRGGVSRDVDVTGGAASLGGTVGGDLNLTGGTVTQGTALDVDGTLDLDVALTTTGAVEAGTVDNSGDLTVADGTVLTITDDDGAVTNTGALDVAGTVAGDVASGGADGDLSLTGEITGGLIVSGGMAALQGTIGEGLRLTGGTVTQTGDLTTGGAIVNDTDLTVGAGNTLTAPSVFNRAPGSFTVNGNVVANVRSRGELALGDAATVTGDLDVEAGAAGLAGRVNGDVTLSAPAIVDQTGVLTVTGELLADTDAQTLLDSNVFAGSLVNDGNLAIGAATISGLGGADLALRNTGTLDARAGSVVTGRIDNDGDLTLAGRTTGDVDTSGTASVSGTVGGTLRSTDGTLGLTGRVAGDLRVTGGEAALAGTVGGDASIRNALAETQGDLAIAGAARVREGGAFMVDDALTSGSLLNEGGFMVTEDGSADIERRFLNSADAMIDGDMTAGTVVNDADGEMAVTANGAVTVETLSNEGLLDLDGSLTGALDNDGRAALAGDVSGAIDNAGELLVDGMASAGSVASRGALEIADDASLRSDVDVAAGTAAIDGQLIGDLRNAGGTAVAGIVTGDTTNTGTLDVLAGATLGDGDDLVLNRGGMALTDATVDGTLETFGSSTTEVFGTVDITGGIDQAGTFSVRDGASLTGGRFENTGRLEVDGTVGNTLDNTGEIIAADGARFDGRVIQNGNLEARGALTLAGGAVLQRGSVIDMQQDGSPAPSGGNGAVAAGPGPLSYDALDVVGPLRGNGAALAFDIDVTENAGGDQGGVFSDFLRVRDGALTGDLRLDFAPQGSPGALDPTGILVVDVDASQANEFELTTTGLEPFGALVYRLEEREGDRFVTTAVNPAIGGLSGTVSLTQSLIGQVVNRPNSPFVGALVAPDGPACGPGLWSRGIGGYADASGAVESTAGDFTNDLEATYGGLQFGGDYGCFDGGFYGFDVAVGGILGLTQGSVTQDVFGFDPDTGDIDTSVTTATIDNQFDQKYAGVYISAARGGLVADLQYRLERTSFDLETESRLPGGGIGARDQSFDSQGQTLSASLSYAFPIGPEGAGLSLGGTTGFAVSRTSTDDVDFAGDARVTFEDTTTKIGFVGASLTRTRVAADERSALTLFGTGTYYGDFSDPIESTFEDGLGGTENIKVDPIGDYGEVSLGMNYVRILEQGQVGPARQLTGSVRVDGRISDQLDSVGVTAQLRLQF